MNRDLNRDYPLPRKDYFLVEKAKAILRDAGFQDRKRIFEAMELGMSKLVAAEEEGRRIEEDLESSPKSPRSPRGYGTWPSTKTKREIPKGLRADSLPPPDLAEPSVTREGSMLARRNAVTRQHGHGEQR